MKIRLADLEELRKDPGGFVTNGGQGGAWFGRPSKKRSLHFAAYAYHRNQDNAAMALAHLDTLFSKFKGQSDRLKHEAWLSDYIDRYIEGGMVVGGTKINIRIGVNEDVQLTGEVSRMDIAPGGGYAVWLFGMKPYTWVEELRMPLLQARFADMMGVSSDQVSVGMYFFETASYEQTSFTADAIQAAWLELGELTSGLGDQTS